ncbi:MAG: cation transporter [Deltaproteobacteria bacterium]|nr:cation transporter [Deltaproteobacteria bacterium]
MKTLKVTGMTCGHCEASVREALEQVTGVEKVVEVDRQTMRAVIEGDAADEALVAAITEVGFEAEVTG